MFVVAVVSPHGGVVRALRRRRELMREMSEVAYAMESRAAGQGPFQDKLTNKSSELPLIKRNLLRNTGEWARRR